MNNVVKWPPCVGEEVIETSLHGELCNVFKPDMAFPRRVCVKDGLSFVLGSNGSGNLVATLMVNLVSDYARSQKLEDSLVFYIHQIT